MAWQVWGETLYTADLASGINIFQPVIPNSNIILKAIRCWFIGYNNPAYTDLYMTIYSNNTGSPKTLLHTSTNRLAKATIASENNWIKEVYFEFDNVNLRSADTYHFVPRATAYTGTDNSHIAWRKGWPDPVYRTNVGADFEDLISNPYCLYLIGAEI